MPRVKLAEQVKYDFSYPVTLQPRDINYGGHLGNDSIVVLVNIARVNMLRSMGFSENDLGDGTTGIIMSDLAINYKAEGFLFDDIIIETHIGEMQSSSFRIFHRMVRDASLIALAETGVVVFDYAHRKITSLPDVFIKKLEEVQEGI